LRVGSSPKAWSAKGFAETSIVRREADAAVSSPWRTVEQAAARAQCGKRAIYKAVDARKLRAVSVNGRGDLRTTDEWVDQWLLEQEVA
jgi:excisionase family DNA binding protein